MSKTVQQTNNWKDIPHLYSNADNGWNRLQTLLATKCTIWNAFSNLLNSGWLLNFSYDGKRELIAGRYKQACKRSGGTWQNLSARLKASAAGVCQFQFCEKKHLWLIVLSWCWFWVELCDRKIAPSVISLPSIYISQVIFLILCLSDHILNVFWRIILK